MDSWIVPGLVLAEGRKKSKASLTLVILSPDQPFRSNAPACPLFPVLSGMAGICSESGFRVQDAIFLIETPKA